MTLRVVPEGLAATSAAVEALTARLAAAHAAAAPAITAVVPPAVDPVSLQTALGLQRPGPGARRCRRPGRRRTGPCRRRCRPVRSQLPCW